LRRIGRDQIWPYWYADPRSSSFITEARAKGWDADTLFDVVEVLHDLVSKPTKIRHHDYMNCGDHATAFNRGAGQREYVRQMDEVLQLHDPPYEFGEDGRLIERVPDEFRDLVDEELPDDVEEDLVAGKVDHAKRLFLARSSSVDDRRNAVRELADVLEALREDMKATMLSKDEGAMFNIANNFAIRHNSREQHSGYDREIWLRWTFYVYLATIHAVLQVREREA
jgi:hypothetical protein